MYTEVSLLGDGEAARESIPSSLEALLPLPDLPGLIIDRDSADKHQNNNNAVSALVATRGGFVKAGDGVTVAWRLIKNDSVVVLRPLSLFGSSGHNIVIESPVKILPDCMTVSEDEEGGIVVDFIVSTGFMYTVHVSTSNIIGGEAFSETTASQWRAIKQPQAFKAAGSSKAAPRLLSALSSHTLVVGLADGTVLRLNRSSILAELHTIALLDPNAHKGFSSWMRGTDRVPGYPDLSVRTIVSAVALNASILATYSVDNSIRLWSLDTNQCLHTLPSQVSEPPRLRPSQYISNADGHLIVFRSTELQLYSFNASDQELVQKAALPVPKDVTGWFLVDLQFDTNANQIFAAFKSHLSTRVYSFSLEHGNNKLVLFYELSNLLSLPDLTAIDDLRQRILGVDTYNSSTRATAFEIFGYSPDQHYSEDEIDADGWLRLDRLCREIEAQGMELLAIRPFDSGLWVVRGSHDSLCLNLPPATDESTQIRDSAVKFWMGIGEKCQEKILTVLNSSVFGVDVTIVDEVESISAALPTDLNPEFRALTHSTLDTAFEKYLQQFAVPDTTKYTDSNEPLSSSGAGALMKLLSQKAGSTVYELRALAVFVVVAMASGAVQDGVGIYSELLRELRIAEVINELRDPTSNNGLYAAVKSLPKSHGDFLLYGASVNWHHFDLSSSSGLELIANLLNSDVNLSNVINWVPSTSVGTFIKGIASGNEALVREVSLSLASRKKSELANVMESDITGMGLAHFYTCASKLMGGSLELAALGNQYEASPSTSSAEWLLQLSLEHGDLGLAYEAITSLNMRKFPVEKPIAQLLDCAARQGVDQATYVVRELPFIGLASHMQRALTSRHEFGAIPSYKLLYGWHVTREDYLGAAQAVYDQISSIKKNVKSLNGHTSGVTAEVAQLFDLYTITMNCLRLMKNERWLLDGTRIVSFEELQNEYKLILRGMVSELGA